MVLKDAVRALEMTSFNTTGLSTSYKAINAGGLEASCVILKIVNTSNKDVTVSFDSTYAHDFIPAGETVQYSFQNNASPASWKKMMAVDTKIYVKGTGAGAGLIYLIGYY